MDKTKIYISGIVALFVFAIIAFGFFAKEKAPREDLLEEQLQDKKEEIAQLNAKIQKYIIENKELSAEVSRLNASQPGGMAVEELREALSAKESEQQHRESRLIARQEALRLAELKVDTLQQEFYEKTGMKLEEIGEAKQIKKEYEYMRKDREQAEAKANSWLIYFSVLLTAFFASVIAIIIAKLKMDAKSKNIENTSRIIDSTVLDDNVKKLLMSSLGKEIISQNIEPKNEI